MPHLHIPLQSGSNPILRKMKRKYTVEMYKDKINKIKNKIEGCTIGVDIMTGFPGETEECFNDTYNLLNDLPISYLHVFPFSERENTLAYKMQDKIDLEIRYARARILRKLSQLKFRQVQQKNINCTRPVLFEMNEDGFVSGLTDNYIRVKVPQDKTEKSNFISNVTLVDINDGIMIGEIVQ